MENNTGLKLRVLVVDDQKLIREPIAEFLQGEGHTVDQADNGNEAWSLLLTQSYDYVVLDLQMPKMGGLDLLRLMRRLTPRPRTILVTGMKTEHVERMALTLGAAGCYEKPLSLDTLQRDLIWAPHLSGKQTDPRPSTG